eukprot:10997499-Karenia_brevis.AAC.1
MVWSLNILYTGKFPDRDWTGRLYQVGTWEYSVRDQWIAGGFRFPLFSLIGDLEYFGNDIGLVGTCYCCRANRTTIPWTAFDEDAAWLTQRWKPAEWRAAMHVIHDLFNIPG